MKHIYADIAAFRPFKAGFKYKTNLKKKTSEVYLIMKNVGLNVLSPHGEDNNNGRIGELC